MMLDPRLGATPIVVPKEVIDKILAQGEYKAMPMNYEKQLHNEAIGFIRRFELDTPEQIVNALVALYQALYEVDAYHINCGLCEDFGNDLISLFGGDSFSEYEEGDPEGLWGNQLSGDDEDGYHYFVEYKGLYYDSEYPQGTPD